jgi:hypothetical protein
MYKEKERQYRVHVDNIRSQHRTWALNQNDSSSAQIPLIKTKSKLMHYSRIIALSTRIGPLQLSHQWSSLQLLRAAMSRLLDNTNSTPRYARTITVTQRSIIAIQRWATSLTAAGVGQQKRLADSVTQAVPTKSVSLFDVRLV